MGTPPVGVYFKSSQTFKDDCDTLTSDSAQPDIKRINPIATGRKSFICKPYTIKAVILILNLITICIKKRNNISSSIR
jgi:hypothetical protein